jgi:hypothetical protein
MLEAIEVKRAEDTESSCKEWLGNSGVRKALLISVSLLAFLVDSFCTLSSSLTRESMSNPRFLVANELDRSDLTKENIVFLWFKKIS